MFIYSVFALSAFHSSLQLMNLGTQLISLIQTDKKKLVGKKCIWQSIYEGNYINGQKDGMWVTIFQINTS